MSGKLLFKSGLIAIAMGTMLISNFDVQAKENMRSAKEVVKEMGVGWNLGNTLDSFVDQNQWFNVNDPKAWETCWGNPVTTKAMIDKVKEAGFTTLRVPVTWGYHLGAAPLYTVDPAWMARVKEVVQYGIDDGMYVILNTHHEDEWCIPTKAKEASYTKQLSSLWTQIANEFKEYDDHLIFEVQNEPRNVGTAEEWIGGTSEGREVVNNFNEAGLSAIRSTGGNNSTRAVMMPTYGASGLENAINDFRVPEDKNVIVSLHAYTPYLFAMTQSGTKEWGTDAERENLKSELQRYHDFFEAKGIPVVMGEYGTIHKDNLNARIDHVKTYVETCTKLGMPCVWWDNNYVESGMDNTYGLLNRNSLSWTFPEIKDAIVNTYNENKISDNNYDVNDDGVIDLSDYTLLRKYINSENSSSIKINEGAADINKDGKIDFFDLVALKSLI